jgi:CzcA family heavy metal efflux pump
MLESLVSWSLRSRGLVVVLACLLLVLGVFATIHARLDVFPEFAPPMVIVQTECPGLSPAEVEQLVTLPIETAINGVPRLSNLRSQSIQGLSVITAFFRDGTDIYRARQQIAERLAELSSQMPAGVKPPRMAPLTSSSGRLLASGFTSNSMSLMALRDRIQWTVRPILLKTPGVANVTIYGGEVRQYQILIRPDDLAARQLGLNDVVEAARQASAVRGAGFLENDQQRINVRSEGQVASAYDLGESLLATTTGTPVRLRDVADVVEGPEPKFGDALIEGEPGIILIAHRQLDADTLDVTRRLEEELDRLRPVLEREGIQYHPGLFRQADFIDHAIGNVVHSLVIGAILVAVVLFIFLYDLRTAIISLTAIPLSLLSAIGILWALGIGLNTLTLGGLAIAVGEVVDDAIIDVENIFRRLRENAKLPSPLSAFDVVFAASMEVRGAVVYATFVVILVFVPVFFLSGLQGRLFAPLGYAYVLAILASLAVALIVTPALCLLLLPGHVAAEEPKFLSRFLTGYDRLLRRMDRSWRIAIALGVLLLAVSATLFSRFGGAFLPDLRDSHFIIHSRGLTGTSLKETVSMGRDVIGRLKGNPLVRVISQNAGRAELGEDTWGVEYSEIEVGLKADAASDLREAQEQLKETTREIPGFSFEVFTFLSERIKELLAGTPAAVAVKLHGESLADLDRAAIDVAALLNSISGRADVRIEAQTGVPEVVVRLRSADLARFGLRRLPVLESVQAAVQGAEVGQVYQGPRTIDIRVMLAPEARRDPAAIGDIWLSVPPAGKDAEAGKRIRLSEVADVFLSDGRFMIAHEGGMRRSLVTCNVKGRDVASFVTELRDRLGKLNLPDGVHYSLAGEHEARSTAAGELLFWSSIAGALILMLLWYAYGSIRQVALILVNLPFALVGGVFAVWAMGGILDIGSLIGFVTLFGITTRNSMMMVSHWKHLHEHEGVEWGPELIFRGARERVAPVLMTALVTGLGLLPIALGSGEAGREIEGPMAWVILGGLATSTALNLLVLPLIYRQFGGPDASRIA